MNKQLIEKVIEANDVQCPEMPFENPLLDRNVTKALSKSFVNILNVSQPSSKINTNLRHSILENIRKLCKIEPGDHVRIEENLIKLLSDFHCTNLRQKKILNTQESATKVLDAFLLRILEDCEISSCYKSSIDPEIIQSLINLKQNEVFDIISEDVIHWDVNDSKYMHILMDIFKNEDIFEQVQLLNDISIKMIPEMEKLFLEICLHVIKSKNPDIECLFSVNDCLQQIIRTCAVSPKCFKICCSALNFIFITSNCDIHIRLFITKFINCVKSISPHVTFTVLYPSNLGRIAVMLDFDVDNLPSPLRDIYIQKTRGQLKKLHEKKESDLIMLLSHFPQWFNIYFEHK